MLQEQVCQKQYGPVLLVRRQMLPYTPMDVRMEQWHPLCWNWIGHATLLSKWLHGCQSYVPARPHPTLARNIPRAPAGLRGKRWELHTVAWPDTEPRRTSRPARQIVARPDVLDRYNGNRAARHAAPHGEWLTSVPQAGASDTPASCARRVLGYYLGELYNHLRRHSSLGRRTPASVYGLERTPAAERLLAPPAETSMIEIPGWRPAAWLGEEVNMRGDGRSIAAAAVASAPLRYASATAARTFPM